MGSVSTSEYTIANPIPFADPMAEIIRHMHVDHKDALVSLARKFARVESSEATGMMRGAGPPQEGLLSHFPV
jgi:hypothetical protein